MGLVDFGGAADLAASGSVNLRLAAGIDMNNPGLVYLFENKSFFFDNAAIANNTINIGTHYFETGDEVTYSQGSATISGLTNGGKYYIIKVSATEVQLSETASGPAIALTATGTGTGHSLTALNPWLSGQFQAGGDNLTFRAALGPLGVFVTGGSASIGLDDVSFGLDLNNTISRMAECCSLI